MNKIHFFAFFLALGLSAPAAFAQDSQMYTGQDITDNGDGTYTIKLESYLKSVKAKVPYEIPTDIVVMLDYCYTMEDPSPVYKKDIYTYKKEENLTEYGKGVSYNELKTFIDQASPSIRPYCLHEGDYYPVQLSESPGSYAAYIEPVSGSRLYLHGSALSADSWSASSGDEILYEGDVVLGYTYNNYRFTGSALFYHDNEGGGYYEVSHEVHGGKYFLSITKSGTKYYLIPGGLSTERPAGVAGNDDIICYCNLFTRFTKSEVQKLAVLEFLEEMYRYSNFDDDGNPREETVGTRVGLVALSSNSKTEKIADLTLMDETGTLSLQNALKSFTMTGRQASDHGAGYTMAATLLFPSVPDENANKKKKVMDISDFITGGHAEGDDARTELTSKGAELYCYIASRTNGYIHNAEDILERAYSTTRTPNSQFSFQSKYEIKVTDSSPDAEDWGPEFLSNFKNAARLLFYEDVDKTLTVDTAVREVVSPEFRVVSSEGTNGVKAYTTDCTSLSPEPVFEDRQDWETLNPPVSLTPNANGTTTLRVTGFDYSENYVGDHGDATYGKKLILEITVKPSYDNWVGGAGAQPGMEYSDIRDPDDVRVTTFPLFSGGIDVPVELHIQKSGLNAGDSAIFKVSRKAGESGTYAPYTRIILTGAADGSAVTATLSDLAAREAGTDEPYYYRVEESSWSLKYNLPNPLTTETQTQNPFQFVNTPKTGVKTAEAKVSNNFGSGTVTEIQ
jgi:hypothetical protein